MKRNVYIAIANPATKEYKGVLAVGEDVMSRVATMLNNEVPGGLSVQSVFEKIMNLSPKIYTCRGNVEIDMGKVACSELDVINETITVDQDESTRFAIITLAEDGSSCRYETYKLDENGNQVLLSKNNFEQYALFFPNQMYNLEQ
ncbi:MAG: hypothetical protein IKR66_07005 [Bacteroidales bacterium]|nr:hypothetical protein [Bacteroidales bacterium]